MKEYRIVKKGYHYEVQYLWKPLFKKPRWESFHCPWPSEERPRWFETFVDAEKWLKDNYGSLEVVCLYVKE